MRHLKPWFTFIHQCWHKQHGTQTIVTKAASLMKITSQLSGQCSSSSVNLTFFSVFRKKSLDFKFSKEQKKMLVLFYFCLESICSIVIPWAKESELAGLGYYMMCRDLNWFGYIQGKYNIHCNIYPGCQAEKFSPFYMIKYLSYKKIHATASNRSPISPRTLSLAWVPP